MIKKNSYSKQKYENVDFHINRKMNMKLKNIGFDNFSYIIIIQFGKINNYSRQLFYLGLQE